MLTKDVMVGVSESQDGFFVFFFSEYYSHPPQISTARMHNMRQKSQPCTAMALTSAILSQYDGSLYMDILLS